MNFSFRQIRTSQNPRGNTARDGTGSLFCKLYRAWSETSSAVTITNPATHYETKPIPPKARSLREPLILFNPNIKRKT